MWKVFREQVVEKVEAEIKRSPAFSFSENQPAAAPSGNALASFNLQKTYGRRRVVDDVSLFVEPGEVVGLLGANGAGKTTTFYLMTGLERAEKGKIMLSGQDVTSLPMYLR